MIGFAASESSFAMSSDIMKELAGLRVGPKTIERAAEALGAEIAEDERQKVDPEPLPASTMYLGTDGTGTPVRPSEREGRTGKQPDGSSKTREAKLVMVWTAEKLNEGIPERDQGSVSYSAAIESAATLDTDKELSPFAQRVDREARRRGFHDAERRVILGDGALWIWNVASELFPDAIQIVDLFHAKQHLKAKEIYGGGEFAEAWARRQCSILEEDHVDKVIAALRKHDAAGYLERNRARMQYAKFRAQGLCISSGVVEAGCKRVVGSRLKRGGMQWTVRGADMALRCCMLSGRFEDFWERRAA